MQVYGIYVLSFFKIIWNFTKQRKSGKNGLFFTRIREKHHILLMKIREKLVFLKKNQGKNFELTLDTLDCVPKQINRKIPNLNSVQNQSLSFMRYGSI